MNARQELIAAAILLCGLGMLLALLAANPEELVDHCSWQLTIR